MAKRVTLSSLAENDLLDIALYIATENPRASDDFVHGLDDKFSLLLTQPEMGRARPELGKKLRSFPIKNYVVFYDPTPEGIFIVRVIHGARDVENVF